MFNSLIVIAIGSSILFNYFDFVQGLQVTRSHKKILNFDQPTLIARERLYEGDLYRVVVNNLGSYKESQIQSALVFLSVMMERTLGYQIDPIFPYLTDKKPVLDCNGIRNRSEVVMNPSTIAFKVDFTKESLKNSPPKTLTYTLYQSGASSTFNYSHTRHNYTDQLVTMTPTEVNGNTLYNLDIVFLIEKAGLYKFYLHSCESDTIFFEDLLLSDLFVGMFNVGIIFVLFAHYFVIRKEFSVILRCHSCTKIGFLLFRIFILFSMMVTAYNSFEVREVHEMYTSFEYMIIIVIVIAALISLELFLPSSFGTVGKILSVSMLLHFVLKNLHRGGSEMVPFGDVLVYLQKTFILILTSSILDIVILYIGESIDPRFKVELRKWHELKFRNNYIVMTSYFVCMVCSCDLVLATMVLFEAHFELYWIPFAFDYFLTFFLGVLFVKFLVEIEKLFFGRITAISARAG